MEAIALRMEGVLARTLNRLAPRFRISISNEERPDQLGALVRLRAAELLVIGYEPTSADRRNAFEMLIAFEADPLLAVMPVAMAFLARHATAFDDEIRRLPQWGTRVLPIIERDFLHPGLPALVERHVERHRIAVTDVRFTDSLGGGEWDEMNFPWECP